MNNEFIPLFSATKSRYILWQNWLDLPQKHGIFCGKRGGAYMTQTIVNAVKSRIIGHGRGWCFTSKHFLDLDSYTGVRTALSRLEQDKMIRRLAQGIYEYPIQHETLGVIPPNIDRVAQAIAEKNGIRVQPSGAYAANLTGISEQVPGRVVFLTDGPAKKLKIGKTEISFRHATVRVMAAAGTKEGLVIQAMKFMKKENINQAARGRIRKFLQGQRRSDLIKNLKYAPAWIRSIVFEIMGDLLK